MLTFALGIAVAYLANATFSGSIGIRREIRKSTAYRIVQTARPSVWHYA